MLMGGAGQWEPPGDGWPKSGVRRRCTASHPTVALRHCPMLTGGTGWAARIPASFCKLMSLWVPSPLPPPPPYCQHHPWGENSAVSSARAGSAAQKCQLLRRGFFWVSVGAAEVLAQPRSPLRAQTYPHGPDPCEAPPGCTSHWHPVGWPWFESAQQISFCARSFIHIPRLALPGSL